MSNGFNVETYQMAKQEALGNESGGTYDILNRIQRLENNQNSIFNEFLCDFHDNKYTDTYLTTTIVTPDGIIARQYKEAWHDNLTYDDCIDWDKSKFIAYTSNSIKLDTPATAYGEFYSLPIDLSAGYVGFKFNADVEVPIIETLLGRETLKQGHLWFAQGTDNYGRVWLFRADTYKFEASPVYLTIYNQDMTINREFTIPGVNFFGPVTTMSQYGYSPVHNCATITFSEENLCIVGMALINATKDGIMYEPWTADANNISNIKNLVTFVDENGNSAVKYNYIQTLSAYNYYHTYGHNYYHSSNQGFEPCKLSIQKNKIVFITAPTARLFGLQTYDTNKLGKVIITPATGVLSDANVAVTVGSLYGSYYELSDTYINNWATRYSTNSFKIGDSTYFFMTDYVAYNGSTPITRMFLAELNANDLASANTFDIDRQYKLNGTMTYPLYNFGGANGLYYCEKYNYLYVFSNYSGSSVLNITRFTVDWTSKNSTSLTINLTSPKTTSVTLQNTTYPGAAFNEYYNQKLKVYEDDKLLNLVFGINNIVNGKREIDFISIDYNLNIVQPATQIHISDGTPVDQIVAFDMIQVGDSKTLIYSRGNRDDFVDATATVNSGIYTNTMQQIASQIDFYYATDTDLLWKPVNIGDTKVLSAPANDIRIRAVLQSSAIYDSSPVINSLSIESWDNDNQISRQSEYYSTTLSVMQNEGKGVLTANQEINEGSIDWYISFNGGVTWTLTQLNEEFVYNYTQTPDFRVKAVLSVTDSAINVPIVHSYTLKTSHMVLHSDLEEIQINLMKTNFKIDTYTKSSKNGLLKMTIDTFSNDTSIDTTKSDYLYYSTTGTVGGNYIITKPEVIEDGILTLLLTTDEVIDDTMPNSKILYEVSIDGGVTFKPITPNTKLQLNNTNSSSDTLVLKAIFYDNARLNAWGWAWD